MLIIVASRICLGQNSYPANGITILNSGGDQNLILKDGRSGMNWNYIEWQFSDGTRDWVMGRRATTGNFTLFRNGLNEVLTIDNTGKVGMGTTTPNSVLDIQGQVATSTLRLQGGLPYSTYYLDVTPFGSSGSVGYSFNLKSGGGVLNNILNFSPSGNLGIGTTSPAFSLDVQGFGSRVKNTSNSFNAYTTFRVQGPDYANGLELDFFGNNNISSDPIYSYGGGPGSAALINVNAKPLVLGTNNQGKMIIDGAGNVGIGTTSPDAKLAVAGQVHAQEVKVSVTVPGPDYVFEKDYQLTSLEEIKNYIDQNKHLPEVPSAKEMEKNGIQLGEMNMLLLKKIEELTLHLLNQEKKFTAQEERIKELESVVKEKQVQPHK